MADNAPTNFHAAWFGEFIDSKPAAAAQTVAVIALGATNWYQWALNRTRRRPKYFCGWSPC